MGFEAHDAGNLLSALTFWFLLGYYSFICLRFKQYDHATNVRLAVLNIAAAVIYLLSAPLPFIPGGCDVFYNAVATLYLGSQILLFNNRVIFSFYQMNRTAQAVLKAVLLSILTVGSVTTTAYLALGTEMMGTMTSGEYACYLVRNGSAQSHSAASDLAVTASMIAIVAGMAVIFAYALIGFLQFKRVSARKESLTTLYLVLLSFGSSAINMCMNTMDQMNMLVGLSAVRKVQEVLDSVIALSLALVVHRKIAARAARVRSAATGETSLQRESGRQSITTANTVRPNHNPQAKYAVSSSEQQGALAPARPE
ncbi:G-protein coupled receptors family 1 profile domain-containing protein [Plasmodiophora brassicae]